MLSGFGLSAQHSTTVAAFLPTGSVQLDPGQPNNPSIRFLTVFYQTVSYPSSVRNYGIIGAILVTCTIDTTGGLTVVDTEFRDPRAPDHRSDSIPDKDILRVIGYGINGPSTPPRPTSNRKRLRREQTDLEKEVARTLRAFPRFEPARRDGQKVPDTQTRLFYFRLQ